MSLLILLLGPFLLGFIGGSIPGQVLTSIFTEVLHKGFIKSLRITFYALLCEVMVATFILLILFSAHIPQGVFYGISFIGALVLLWIARQIWSIKKLGGKGKLFNFKKILLLTVFNGPLWIIWTTICVPQAYLLNQKIFGGEFIFLAFFELGWLSATTILTFIFSRFRPLLTKEDIIGNVFKVFALMLSLFSARLVYVSVMYFIK